MLWRVTGDTASCGGNGRECVGGLKGCIVLSPFQSVIYTMFHLPSTAVFPTPLQYPGPKHRANINYTTCPRLFLSVPQKPLSGMFSLFAQETKAVCYQCCTICWVHRAFFIYCLTANVLCSTST